MAARTSASTSAAWTSSQRPAADPERVDDRLRRVDVERARIEACRDDAQGERRQSHPEDPAPPRREQAPVGKDQGQHEAGDVQPDVPRPTGAPRHGYLGGSPGRREVGVSEALHAEGDGDPEEQPPDGVPRLTRRYERADDGVPGGQHDEHFVHGAAARGDETDRDRRGRDVQPAKGPGRPGCRARCQRLGHQSALPPLALFLRQSAAPAVQESLRSAPGESRGTVTGWRA